MSVDEYRKFLESKNHCGAGDEIPFKFSPDGLFDFQRHIIQWSLRKGRSAIFADCGLGKTIMELTWAQNIVMETNKPVLVLAPLAVTYQTVKEGEKFDIECEVSRNGLFKKDIVVTNYERLKFFNPDDFSAVVCDESGCLKSFMGSRRKEVTGFLTKIKYRCMATATPSPNDYSELGTTSEALGETGLMDMLNKYFHNNHNDSSIRRLYGEGPTWSFKGHAEIPFWRWVTSWAIACRFPSDLGFSNFKFVLPELEENRIQVDTKTAPEGMLFELAAHGLHEQRHEKMRTLVERCEKVAELVGDDDYSVSWCHLNDEGDLLEKLIPDSVQVSGRDSNDAKEEKLMAFSYGEVKKLITKPKIGAWGLNWQHCNHLTFFPSHSFEQYYQSVRRCWRFGQERPVTVDVVMTKGDEKVMTNMMRKSDAADGMFKNLMKEMSNARKSVVKKHHNLEIEAPSWMQ